MILTKGKEPEEGVRLAVAPGKTLPMFVLNWTVSFAPLLKFAVRVSSVKFPASCVTLVLVAASV